MSPDELWSVVSTSEAAEMWDRHKDTIVYHIDRGNLRFRQLPHGRGLFLISVQSLIELYGPPAKPKFPIVGGTSAPLEQVS